MIEKKLTNGLEITLKKEYWMVSKKKIFLLVWILIGNCFAGQVVDIYVSPKGSDENTGTIDKPLRTIDKAKSILLKKKADDVDQINIFLREGKYILCNTLHFDLNCGGNGDQSITIRSYNDEKVVISGGRQIKNMVQQGNLWVADLSRQGDENWNFRNLYVDGKRAVRARFPDNGYLRIKKCGEDRQTNFNFYKNDIPRINSFEDVELVFFHDWSISRVPIKKIDYQKEMVYTKNEIGALQFDFFAIDGSEKHARYFLENSFEFLNQPGEWFLDKEKSKLYYYPREGQDIKKVQFVVPVLTTLMTIKGDPEACVRIKNIHFEGIIFAYTDWQLPEQGYIGIQACYSEIRPLGKPSIPSLPDRSEKQMRWKPIPAAILVDNAENCSFQNCIFEHLGTSGLWFKKNCRNNIIKGNLLKDISGNGLMVGEDGSRTLEGVLWYIKAPQETCSSNTICDNIITECGKEFFGAVGIWAGLTEKTLIKNNLLFDLPYTGISNGWVWSNLPTVCALNRIENNHIYRVMLEMSDGGAIYNLGRQPSSVIKLNLIHDIPSSHGRAPNQAIRFDDGASGFIVSENVVYNVEDPILWFNAHTYENMVTKNYVMTSAKNILLKALEKEWNQFAVINHTSDYGCKDNIIKDNFVVEGKGAMQRLKPYVDAIKTTCGPPKEVLERFSDNFTGVSMNK